VWIIIPIFWAKKESNNRAVFVYQRLKQDSNNIDNGNANTKKEVT
jgi:hypothetical protein